VPARAAEFKDDAIERGVELKDEAVERGTELKDRVVERSSDVRDQVVERGRAEKDRAVGAAQRLRASLSRTPKQRWAAVAGAGVAMILLTVIVRRVKG
jgi:hypothetical protein